MGRGRFRDGWLVPDMLGPVEHIANGDAMNDINGKAIHCARCDGHGLILGDGGEPDECPDCGGSRVNWKYNSGVIARYYTGPFLGREEP